MPIPAGWELVILLGVLVLVFGAKKLPDMARSVGQSARVFKGEMKGLKQDSPDAPLEATAGPSAQRLPAEPVTAPAAQPAAVAAEK